jgi:hypothetical protein
LSRGISAANPRAINPPLEVPANMSTRSIKSETDDSSIKRRRSNVDNRPLMPPPSNERMRKGTALCTSSQRHRTKYYTVGAKEPRGQGPEGHECRSSTPWLLGFTETPTILNRSNRPGRYFLHARRRRLAEADEIQVRTLPAPQ